MLVLAFLAALALPARAVETQSFSSFRESFVQTLVTFRPEAATGLGLPAGNGNLTMPTPEGIAGQIAFFERVERDLASLKPADAQERVDARVMATIARSALHELRDRQGYLTDVGAAQGPYDVVQVQVSQMGTGEKAAREWADITSRAEQLPAYLAAVRANLDKGAREGRQIYKGFVEKDGVQAAGDAAEFFEKELLQKAREQLDPLSYARLESRLSSAGAKAAEAYRAHAAFLSSEILPKATGKYGIGEEEYSWKLKHELGIEQTPSALAEKGRALAASITARMEELARKIDPTKTLPELMAALKADHPKDDAELLKTYREVSTRARDFVVANKLFDIPADYSIGVIETPPGMRSHIGSAAYFPAPPLDAAKKGVFLVTPSAGTPQRLAIHNFSKIPTTVVHEAFPGHDMQFWSFQRSWGVSTARYLLDQAGFAQSLNVEGYAHYAEELMRARGFFTPKEELAQLGAQLWRAWRIVLDVGLHSGTLDMAAVSQTLAERAFLPQAIADVEAYRYAKMPTQAITYLLGRLQIEDLKEAYQKKRGAAYSEAEFHREFLSYGPALPSDIRRELIGEKRGFLASPAAKVAASIAAAALFGLGVLIHSGADLASQFVSAYAVEWTMSVDNLAIIAAVLAGLPAAARPKVATIGLLGTIALRLAMAAAGISVALAHPLVFVAGGVFLLAVAVKLLKPEWDLVGRAARALKVRAGFADKLKALNKPVLLGALAVIFYDAVCALDSVPAALALSKSLPIVFAANVFALLGLRSLLSVFQRLEEKFPQLDKGVAAVLVFVAGKMILEPLTGLQIGSLLSLAVVFAALGASMLASLLPRFKR